MRAPPTLFPLDEGRKKLVTGFTMMEAGSTMAPRQRPPYRPKALANFIELHYVHIRKANGADHRTGGNAWEKASKKIR